MTTQPDTKEEYIKMYNIFFSLSLTFGIEQQELLDLKRSGKDEIETSTHKLAALISCKLYPPYGPPFMQKFIDRVNKDEVNI